MEMRTHVQKRGHYLWVGYFALARCVPNEPETSESEPDESETDGPEKDGPETDGPETNEPEAIQPKKHTPGQSKIPNS